LADRNEGRSGRIYAKKATEVATTNKALRCTDAERVHQRSNAWLNVRSLEAERTMKRKSLVLVLAILLISSVPALADGKFYWPEPVPPEIPYQRALLLFDGQQETLILQSKYRVASSATADSFGWVVPLPSVPELASMDADAAERLFFYLARLSDPKLTRISDIFLPGILFVLLLGSILTLLACLLSAFVPRMRWVQRHRRWLVIGALLALVLSACVFFGATFGAGPIGSLETGVDVIKAEQVGIYDVQVVTTDRATDLIQWLNENQSQFDQTDTQVFDEYLRRGWCFVVARIDASSSDADDQAVVTHGLVAPLIMRFRTEAPVYPLALTATSGHNTQVLLYVLSESKWESGGRLALHYAGGGVHLYHDLLKRGVEPEGFFSQAEIALSYLCKFEDMLTPWQMEEDLVLALAKDREPYREHIIEW
jgi:hypothetical protein